MNHKKKLAQRIQKEDSLLTLEIISDLHTLTSFRNSSLAHALADIESRQTKTLAILGDITNNGYMFQWKSCLKQLQEYPFHYLVALGNHDTYNLHNKTQTHIHPLYKELLLKDSHTLYYDTYINHLHFYILNSEKPSKSNAYYSQNQLSWLSTGLANDPQDQPVFILGHHPFFRTHANTDDRTLSMGIQEADLKAVLKKHDHVIFLSGHVHNSYELCDVIYDENLALIDVPSFVKPDFGSQRAHVGYQLQIYHDFIYLRTRDYETGTWIISHERIIDFKKHQGYSLDGDLV